MSTLTPKERIGRALDELTVAARPIVTSELRRAYGDEWFRRAQEGPLARSPWAREDNIDAYIALALLSWAWDGVFAVILPAHARRLVSKIAEARNDWAHQVPFSPSEADDIVRAIAELIALFPSQGYRPGSAPTWSIAPPPPAPFRLPGRRIAAPAAVAPPDRRQARTRPRGRRWPRGCVVALVLLLVPAVLCGMGSLALRANGDGGGAAMRTATATTSARVTPTPVVAKPTVRPTAVIGRYVVINTGGVGVYLRAAPESDEKLRAYPEGTLLQSIGVMVTSTGGNRWRHVRAPDGTEGWVADQYLLPSP